MFISHCACDEYWHSRLMAQLRPYIRVGLLATWDGTDLLGGENRPLALSHAISRARVAVVLVSPDYLASDALVQDQLSPLLESARKRQLALLWVPVRASAVMRTELSEYQAAWNPRRPISTLPRGEVDQALVRVCEQVLRSMGVEGGATGAAPRGAPGLQGRHELRGRQLLWVSALLGVCGAGVLGWASCHVSAPEVQESGGSWRMNCRARGDVYVVLDRQGKKETTIGLARVKAGWLRPEMELDIPDPGQGGRPAYPLRLLAAGESLPGDLSSVGAVSWDGGQLMLNLGQRHGVLRGWVYHGPDDAFALVDQVEERRSHLHICAGPWNHGARAIHADLAAVVQEQRRLSKRLIGDHDRLRRVRDTIGCLDGGAEIGHSVQEPDASARHSTAASGVPIINIGVGNQGTIGPHGVFQNGIIVNRGR